jgi:hypothetical protein
MATKKRLSGNAVSRQEFVALVRAVEDLSRALKLQFTRIAQIQAELDSIRAAWTKTDTKTRRAVVPPHDTA